MSQANERPETIHEIALLWRALVLKENRDLGNDLSIAVVDGEVTIFVSRWRYGWHTDCEKVISARRLRFWHTQERIFKRLNRRLYALCRKACKGKPTLPKPDFTSYLLGTAESKEER